MKLIGPSQIFLMSYSVKKIAIFRCIKDHKDNSLIHLVSVRVATQQQLPNSAVCDDGDDNDYETISWMIM